MNWRTWIERLAVALLVIAFALFFALALWRLTGEQNTYALQAEETLSQRYDSISTVSAGRSTDTETQLRTYSVREAQQEQNKALLQPDETELANLSLAALG